jgi:hypothetical protein
MVNINAFVFVLEIELEHKQIINFVLNFCLFSYQCGYGVDDHHDAPSTFGLSNKVV